jgi:5'-nucleotidase
MSSPTQLPLVVGISTRALFDLEEEHQVFQNEGVERYALLQRERENTPLQPGTAFEVVRRLLGLNAPDAPKLIDVIFLSRNSPDLSLRAFRSAEHHGLQITRGSFTSGRTVSPFVRGWGVELFLSNDEGDVRAAVEAGTAAARLCSPPQSQREEPDDEVRIALDGDAVVFSDASDQIFRERELKGFLEHERMNAEVPMEPGPFGNFIRNLSEVRAHSRRQDGSSRVRIGIVTARNAPAHERVVHTLRAWGTPADEAHFVGTHSKADILAAFGAHIFFDDQEKHVFGAAPIVPAGLVPGPHEPSVLITPSSD